MTPLPSAANRAKTKWNSANYSQIKVSVPHEISDAFRDACKSAGVSMASELSRFMAEYGAADICAKNGRKTASMVSFPDKKKRRKTIGEIALMLEQVRDAEEQAMENTPENLRGSANFQASSDSVSLMDDALDLLGDIY